MHMNFRNRLRVPCIAFALTPCLAAAHHGQDFLLVESPAVPHPGSVYLIADAHAAISGDAEEQASFEPALLFGVTPRIAFELHAHSEKLEGESWAYEATAPSIHLLLTDPEKESGPKVGLSAEYEIASEDGEPNNTEVRLSVESGSGQNKWAGNLIASREQGGSTELGVALGFRRQIRAGVALGAEGQGSFERAEGAQLLATTYFEKEAFGTFKIGLGGQRIPDGDFEPALHLGLVLRVH
jgi:hypothetical protein